MVLNCWHHNFKQNNTNFAPCDGSFKECARLLQCDNENTQSSCFALAKLNPDNITATISSAGCFSPSHTSEQQSVCDTSQCLGDLKLSTNYYCCCNKDGCNDLLTPRPKPPTNSLESGVNTTRGPEGEHAILESSSNHSVILFTIIILTTVILGLFVRRWLSNRKLKIDRNNLLALANVNHNKSNQHQMNNHEIIELEPKFDPKNVQLLGKVGSGRFGTVYKANLSRDQEANHHNETGDGETQGLMAVSEIAVKQIENQEHQSFRNELTIYSLSRMRHPNILSFLGSCENPETNSHWLLVEYASNGSLHHYLKEHTVTWDEFLNIALGIVRGLSHLHDADVAHRDFKSKNVLLRHNLSPCITDFGVATILDMTGGSHTQQRKNYLQVGTPRYMAPEVLECSVAFTKISFTKIDVYALSLVLWELMSRCHPLPKLRMSDYDDMSTVNHIGDASGQDEVPPYRLPFEDQVGSNPDINTMRQVVVCDRLRPPFRQCWSYYPLSKMCQAIVDGWEYDHDARISASCFVERIETLSVQKQQQQQEHRHS